MSRLVECVPNVSEGRDRATIEALVAAIAAVPGVTLLDHEMDADHHRSVLTFAGEPEPVMEAAFQVARLAAERIDLNRHQGEHPRMGATDVIPFVPVEGVTLEECAGFARTTGRRIGDELGIPVFLYEAAASDPKRKNLADVRRGEFEGLREAIGRDPERAPDFGPSRIHPTAGAVAVGARRFLVAFNVNLDTGDVSVAKAVAKAVRESSGGLPHVRALGFSIEGGRRAQVSMNLVNTEATPVHVVVARVREEAAKLGAGISGCEVVGLIPQAAMLDVAEHALTLERFRRDQVLEIRLGRPPLTGASTIGAFLDAVAAGTPTPGGGTVAAFAGALGAALASMVAHLTVGRKKYADREAAMKEVLTRADALRLELLSLARRDGEAFEAVLAAGRLPKAAEEEIVLRDKAMAVANLEAARVPLRTAEACLEVADLAARSAQFGNPNAATDAGVAGLLARAAAEGALLNVQINLKSLPEGADKHGVEMDLHRLANALRMSSGERGSGVSTLDES